MAAVLQSSRSHRCRVHNGRHERGDATDVHGRRRSAGVGSNCPRSPCLAGGLRATLARRSGWAVVGGGSRITRARRLLRRACRCRARCQGACVQGLSGRGQRPSGGATWPSTWRARTDSRARIRSPRLGGVVPRGSSVRKARPTPMGTWRLAGARAPQRPAMSTPHSPSPNSPSRSGPARPTPTSRRAH